MPLKHPKLDLHDRLSVWNQMQMMYMDIDIYNELNCIADVCAQSKYSVEELELILFNEVHPAVSFNLTMIPFPEWRGFTCDWLKERVLQKHRFGKPKQRFFVSYPTEVWEALEPLIKRNRMMELPI